jgi:hypothetical protein
MNKKELRKIIRQVVAECLSEKNPDMDGWSVIAVGYPGMGRGSSPKWAIHKDNSDEYLTKDGKWDIPMYAKTFWDQAAAQQFANEKLGGGEVTEMTGTGAVQGYMTPNAFSKKVQEQEEPEPYNAETDQFSPGPRQRPENW